MRLIDQFQKLHTLLAKTPEQPGLPALAETLNCSERNARLLLRKMEEKGWLRWEAARGRGHFSRLTMLASPQQVALDHLSGLLADGELEEAFASLDGEQRKLLMARLPDFLHAPQAGGSRNRLRIPLGHPIETLDPTDITTSVEGHLVGQIFSRLTEFDRTTQQLLPGLAHYWEPEDDARTWHFWLRPGLSFHDGSEVETEDVRQTLLRLRDKAGDAAYLYEHLDTIEIGDGRRVTCRLKFTDYLWPYSLAATSASIIPRNRSSDFSLMPVGSGPFKVTRRSEYRLTLTVFEDYYRERALLDEIDLWVIAPSEETSAFDLHFGYTGSSSKTQHQVAQVLPGCTSVRCNSNRPLLASAEQRLALADWLAPSVLIAADDESRRPASGLLPDWQHRVAAPRGRPPIPEHTRLTMVTIRITGRLAALTESIKERLKEARIELDVVALSVPEYMRYEWLDFADLVLDIEPLNNYADLDCYGWFSSSPILRKWSPPACHLLMDKQLRAIRANADGEARMQAYAELGKQLVMEGLLIPISHEIVHVQAEAHVGGVKNLAFGLMPFADLWLR